MPLHQECPRFCRHSIRAAGVGLAGPDPASRRHRNHRLRVAPDFSNQINPIPPVQPRRKKYSPSCYPQISAIMRAPHPLHEGRIAIVTDVGMGCGGRGSVGRVRCVRRAVFRERSQRAGRMTLLRTAKPCGPDTRCWCQVARRLRQLNRA